jgi:hypothetical protein
MERSTQIWIGVVVLAALGGAVYKVSKDDATKGTATTTSADLPEMKASDDIDKISITNAEKGEVVLEKKGAGAEAKWELTKPVKAMANQANVKQLLENMKELKAKEVIAQAPSEDQKKEFLFDKDKAVHVAAWKGADKKLDINFGKSGARGQMAMVEGKPSIYSVNGYSSYLYMRELKGWQGNVEAEARQDAEDAKCKWATICTLGRFPDGSERTSGIQTFNTKGECESMTAGVGVPCGPCRCSK